jgi:hypothetical protein
VEVRKVATTAPTLRGRRVQIPQQRPPPLVALAIKAEGVMVERAQSLQPLLAAMAAQAIRREPLVVVVVAAVAVQVSSRRLRTRILEHRSHRP